MSRDQFYNLVKELNPFITPNPLSPNRRALPADKKLAITLYYLKDTVSLPMTAIHLELLQIQLVVGVEIYLVFTSPYFKVVKKYMPNYLIGDPAYPCLLYTSPSPRDS